MAISEGRPMFLKSVDCSGETKDKYFIANLIKEVINEVGHEKVIQVITDNAPNCKAAGQIIKSQFSTIVWAPCVVHILNLALKNICAAKNVENNQLVYKECSWISDIASEVMFVKNSIMNHSMQLAMFNEFVSLKFLFVAETRFASSIIMLKRFKLIIGDLQVMVISDKWANYKEDDVVKARRVKDLVLNNLWWDKIDYILAFTTLIYDMIRACDTDAPCLHLVYDMWDEMIIMVKATIYKHEGLQPTKPSDFSSFYDVVYNILIDRWNKNNTPLHCLAHSLNPRYYSKEWLSESPNRVAPHQDIELSQERMKYFNKYFSDPRDRATKIPWTRIFISR
ncbi:uncharacterized protein LOC120090855 [Benincasa hispida]|uniref:uncharacterized protein LOC120090855 n=1 Tax=Benincasa hispida TaxID=102211 RepID=UPI0018FF56C0|nr:uncharacterized protein LOC120090855 [Benincasa hispida]